MENLILNPIEPLLLLGIAIFLIVAEVFVMSFIAVWFAIAFIAVSIVSVYISFSDGVYQLTAVAVISLLSLFALRTKAMEKLLKSEKVIKEDFLNTSGTGIFRNNKIEFKGTYWDFECESDTTFEENEKVKVLSTNKNIAIIEKK